MKQTNKYTTYEFQRDIEVLADKIKYSGLAYASIYPIPRGGIPVACALAERLNIPINSDLSVINNGTCLVVDDLVDTGKTRSKYERYDFACLHIKDHTPQEFYPTFFVDQKKEWVTYWWEGMEKSDNLEDNIVRILQFIGEDPTRVGLLETPKRVVKMYKEFFAGYDPDRLPRIMTVPNGEDGVVYNEMLIDSGYFFSFCEHHMVPFFGQYYYGYIPNKLIMGASKIGRTIDYYAGRLQVAERLVNQVVNRVDEVVKPHGQVLVMKARHLCKEMRGLKKWDSPYEAIAVRGSFTNNLHGCKDEFMSRIQGGR